MGDRRGHEPAGPARRAQTVGNVREVLNGIFYVLWTGCQWKALPRDLPPKKNGARLSRALELGRHLTSITRCTWPCATAKGAHV